MTQTAAARAPLAVLIQALEAMIAALSVLPTTAPTAARALDRVRQTLVLEAMTAVPNVLPTTVPTAVLAQAQAHPDLALGAMTAVLSALQTTAPVDPGLRPQAHRRLLEAAEAMTAATNALLRISPIPPAQVGAVMAAEVTAHAHSALRQMALVVAHQDRQAHQADPTAMVHATTARRGTGPAVAVAAYAAETSATGIGSARTYPSTLATALTARTTAVPIPAAT